MKLKKGYKMSTDNLYKQISELPDYQRDELSTIIYKISVVNGKNPEKGGNSL
jgi:hypothetical protein